MVMRKQLWIATALAALLVTPALAQETAPTTPPVGQQPAPAPQAAAGSSSPLRFVDAQQPGETLASSLMGTQVYNAENQSLGEINDVLLAADGRLKAVVVGVGGFLGIGERDVAVPWETLKVSQDEEQDLVLRLEVGREQLEQAPAFTTVAEREAAERAAQAAKTPPATGTGMGAGGAVVPAPTQQGAPATPPQ
jgi:hypothetical protein